MQPLDRGLEVQLMIKFSFAIEGVKNLNIYVGTLNITGEPGGSDSIYDVQNIMVSDDSYITG